MKARTDLRAGTFAALFVLAGALHMLPSWAQNPRPEDTVQPAHPAAAASAQRVALVIGNNAYKEAPLLNPVNDARAIADSLRAAGFQVTLRTDIGHRDFGLALREFGDALRRGGAGVFYFAGHGMQIKGRNYLVPVGAAIEREDEVAYAAVDAQAVLDKMEVAGNSTNVMILDACRNNPFARSFRSSAIGLAQMDAPVGTLVAFATAPGAVASDGAGRNGLYTQHLLAAMATPGLKIEDVFKQTRTAVRRDSQGKQVPWETTSLEGDFYFIPAPATATAQQSAPPVGPTAAGPAPPPAAAPPATVTPAPVIAASPTPTPLPAASAGPPPAASKPRPSAIVGAPVPEPIRPQWPVSGSSRVNAHGYALGDKWNYQVVDRYKGEVVRNYALQVTRIHADGSWSAGNALYDPAGRLRRLPGADGQIREFDPFVLRWWPGMKVGERMQQDYEDRITGAAAGAKVFKVHAEARALRRESVRVPAGDFDAILVEVKGSSVLKGQPGFGHFTVSYWYAPELHTLVALEERGFWNGKLDNYARHELTSLRLMNLPAFR